MDANLSPILIAQADASRQSFAPHHGFGSPQACFLVCPQVSPGGDGPLVPDVAEFASAVLASAALLGRHGAPRHRRTVPRRRVPFEAIVLLAAAVCGREMALGRRVPFGTTRSSATPSFLGRHCARPLGICRHVSLVVCV